MCLLALGAFVSGRGEDLSQIARSPYLIEEYVRDHKTFNAGDLWKALSVPELVSDPHFPSLAGRVDCESACEALIQPLQISDGANLYIALRFTERMEELNRYLVFRRPAVFTRGNVVWTLAGYIDSGVARYFDPVLYEREPGGKWWLVLSEQSGSGTGFYSSLQRWFEVQAGLLREVLSILDNAYILGYPGEFVLRPAAIITDYQHTTTGDIFRILFRVTFTLIDDDGVDRAFFGSTEKTYFHRRDRNEVAFHLTGPEHAPGDDILDIHEDRATWFLRQDFDNLRKIARGRPSVEEKWLQDNLKDFPPSAQRLALIRALQAAHQTRRAAVGSIRVARRAGM